jgi:chromosome segregation ATPase
MSKQVTAKQIAIDEMFKANEIQKLKRKEASSEIESLKKLVQEGRDALSRKDREISDFEGRYKKLQSTHTQLQSDLKTAQHDIDGLQHMVKEKDILIDKKKHSHSEIQKSLNAVEERANEMEKEKSALSKSLQATKARLNKIESYTAQHSDCDEDSLWVTSKSKKVLISNFAQYRCLYRSMAICHHRGLSALE